ncbi:MAG: PEP-utilizing enzyme [Thermodesulfobacteriota bacterium]|jgi:pyruvate,water dikinase|nr:MAG: PEP-utilizing enzyme [Thermodesulfobacteriota bacterium]
MLEKIFQKLKFHKSKSSRDTFSEIFRIKYEHFRELLNANAELAKIIADIEEKLQGHTIFGMSYVRSQAVQAVFYTLRMVKSLNALANNKYFLLVTVLEGLHSSIKEEIEKRKESPIVALTLPFSEVNREMVDWVGAKSANLGEMLNRLHLPISPGFAITTRAFDLFLQENNLIDEINKKKIEFGGAAPETINILSKEIQDLIISAPVPPALGEAILAAYDHMMGTFPRERHDDLVSRVALRSSAVGEDSELSFAGQYVSVLNVSRDKIIQTYKDIVAGLFAPRAISYRFSKGVRFQDIAMGVACLQMVESVASGVVYSRHPFNPLENHFIITALWGLGPYAVEGVITPDTYTVAKDNAHTILQTTVAIKPRQLVSNPDGGLKEVLVSGEKQGHPCLSPEQIKMLAEYAGRIEKHYGAPQDIEWALDKKENIFLLQTRPLRLSPGDQQKMIKNIPQQTEYSLLVENGAVAFPGVGFGKAFVLHSDENLSNFPEGGILVAKHSSPDFVIVMPKAKAIVTDTGSVTGHMASLVREFGIPTILDAKNATRTITSGLEITVDAYSGRVYQGKVPELLNLQINKEPFFKDAPVYQALKRVGDFIVPLRLFDPKAPEFSPEHCKSLHDIMRLVHEFSYAEMFQISDLVSDVKGGALKLDAPLPLDFYIIDLGEGLTGLSENTKKVTVDKIVSVPFRALLQGMLHEDLRFQGPRPIELKGFFSVMSEQMFSNPQAAERFGERTYAIISDKYLNFSSRVGYHYGILDAYCGKSINKNYITFSFKGGAADDVRRNRRARMIAFILKALDFSVEVIADRVDARLKKYESSVIEEKLDLLGRLLQFTRQMDMLMDSEASVETIAKKFLEGKYDLEF